MIRNQHSDAFREQALSKVRQRGTRSVSDIAEELSMSAGTLRKWWGRSNRAVVESTPTAQLPCALAAESWRAPQRLLALQETHGLSGPALHAWCREQMILLLNSVALSALVTRPC